jgi:hypothetical protein
LFCEQFLQAFIYNFKINSKPNFQYQPPAVGYGVELCEIRQKTWPKTFIKKRAPKNQRKVLLSELCSNLPEKFIPLIGFLILFINQQKTGESFLDWLAWLVAFGGVQAVLVVVSIYNNRSKQSTFNNQSQTNSQFIF